MFDEANLTQPSKIVVETQFGLPAKRRPLNESLICESIILKYHVELQ